MRVLNICASDFANFGHDNAKALRSVGVDAECIKLSPHDFKYGDEARIVTAAQMMEETAHADLVQIMHSSDHCLKLCKCDRIWIVHTGTPYRINAQGNNAIFNPRVERTIIALTEFAGLGAVNETYIVGAIDTDKLTPGKTPAKPYVFGHYPSNAGIKGTARINECMAGFNYQHSVANVPYVNQLARLMSCDIYIEMFATHQGSHLYGSWGITTLECAAMGKIIITNHTTSHVYEQYYGIIPPLLLFADSDGLKAHLNNVSRLSVDKLISLQNKTRNWIVDYHSYKATGETIKKYL